MKSFENKVVVITGAGSGIGRALAIEFNKLGAKLALNDNNESTLAKTAGLIGSRDHLFLQSFDVSDKTAFYSFADKVVLHYGQVDVVVNNAGVAISNLLATETTIADYEWLFGINLWGMIYGSLAFLPHLRKQEVSCLVNLSSIFGMHGVPYHAAYCTTKFGIRGFTETLALEERLGQTGVTVISVHPGGIKTNIARNARYGNKDESAIREVEKIFITTPQKAAQVIIAGIRRRKARILIGPDAKFLFLVTSFSLGLISRLIIRFVKKSNRL